MNAVLEAPQEVAQENATSMPPRHPNRTPRPAQRIVLTGFMGSGKSTVGPLLAELLGWNFVDLDDVIAGRAGLSIPQIFSSQGEAGFRHEETSALVSVLGRPRTVIALGGGAPETLGNRLLLEQTPATAVVYLEAPFATLAERCALQAQDPTATPRPNFNVTDADAARHRFESRHPLYLRLASLRTDAGNRAARSIAVEIADSLLLSPA